MGEQRPGSYPSPNAAQVASPFFQQPPSTSAQDVPAMISQELSAELARALNNEAQRHDDSSGPQMPALELQQQLAQDAMGHLGPGDDYDEGEDEISDGGTHHKRKRQKLSGDAANRQKNTRACDECRRKKVKCESEIGQELGIEACLACRKSGLQCQFSRVPQKRGPSKGYISKLDERLQNVENAIREYLPQAAHRIGRPEAGDPSTYDLHYADDTPHAEPGPSQDAPLSLLGSGDTSSYWTGHAPRQPAQLPDLAAIRNVSAQDPDENALAECYDRLQATVPVFATDRAAQLRLLEQVSPTARAAFTSALNLLVRAMGDTRASVTQAELKTVAQLCLEADFEQSSTVKSVALIQTYILLSLTAEELGPTFAHGNSATSSQKMLSQANNLAVGLNLHHSPLPREERGGPGNLDPIIARRLYISLYIVDRWLAIGYGSPFRVHVPNDRLVLLPEDRDVVGQQCYQMARICTLFTQVANSLPAILAAPAPTAAQRELDQREHTVDLIQAIFDRIADDLAPFSGLTPVLQAALSHADLLIYRLRSETKLSIMTRKTTKLLDTVQSTATSPLCHNFTTLCGLSLAELVLHQQDKTVSIAAVRKIEQFLATRPPRDGSWEQAVSTLINAAVASGDQDAVKGLHDLADAAVTGATVRQLQQHGGFDMATLIGRGYLAELVPTA